MSDRLSHNGVFLPDDANEDCVNNIGSKSQPADIKAGPNKEYTFRTECRGIDETEPRHNPEASNCTRSHLGAGTSATFCGAGSESLECNGLHESTEHHVTQDTECHGQDLFPASLQAFWLEWVEKTFPALETQSHTWPGLAVNNNHLKPHTARVTDVHPDTRPATPTAHAQGAISKPASVPDSSVALQTVMGHVIFSLCKMFEVARDRVTVLRPQECGDHPEESCYAGAAARVLHPPGMPKAPPRRFREGEFDVLLIHRQFGLVVCEAKAFADVVQQTDASQHGDVVKIVGKALKDMAKRLDEADGWMSHLVSDVAPRLRITKTMAFPNLTTDQLRHAVAEDVELQEELRRCLKAERPADVSSLCICSDQLCDSGMRGGETARAVRRLKEWWSERVIRHGLDEYMTRDLYKILVARFCGAASTVSLPCSSLPRLCLETRDCASPIADGRGLSAHIALAAEQARLLNAAPPKVFLTGPPGTGKTVTLLLMAKDWLRRQRAVCVLSTWDRSYMACAALHGLLQRVSETEGHDKLRFLEYNFRSKNDVEKAVDELKALADGEGELWIVADEAGPDVLFAPQDDCQALQAFSKPHFQLFCDRLQAEVPRLHLWAASCRQRTAHPDWHVHHFTRAFRQPPRVSSEAAKADEFQDDIEPYMEEGALNPDEGSVTFIPHGGQGHERERAGNCVTCGVRIAAALHGMGVGSASVSTDTCGDTTDTPVSWLRPADGAKMEYRDVLLVSTGRLRHDSGVVEGLRSCGLPARVLDTRNRQDVLDVATSRSDVVWVLSGTEARGVERRVVVCLRDEYPDTDIYNRLYPVSRCTSHLLLVAPPAPGECWTC